MRAARDFSSRVSDSLKVLLPSKSNIFGHLHNVETEGITIRSN